MWKAKVKDQLLACAIAFMWTWNEHTGKGYLWPKMASDMISECQKVFMAGVCPSSPSRCMLRAHWMCPCCAHINCSSWLRHWSKYNTSYTLTLERHIIRLNQLIHIDVTNEIQTYTYWYQLFFILPIAGAHTSVFLNCLHSTKTQMQLTALYT